MVFLTITTYFINSGKYTMQYGCLFSMIISQTWRSSTYQSSATETVRILLRQHPCDPDRGLEFDIFHL